MRYKWNNGTQKIERKIIRYHIWHDLCIWKKVAEIDSNETKNHQMPKPSSEIKASVSARSISIYLREISMHPCGQKLKLVCSVSRLWSARDVSGPREAFLVRDVSGLFLEIWNGPRKIFINLDLRRPTICNWVWGWRNEN